MNRVFAYLLVLLSSCAFSQEDLKEKKELSSDVELKLDQRTFRINLPKSVQNGDTLQLDSNVVSLFVYPHNQDDSTRWFFSFDAQTLHPVSHFDSLLRDTTKNWLTPKDSVLAFYVDSTLPYGIFKRLRVDLAYAAKACEWSFFFVAAFDASNAIGIQQQVGFSICPGCAPVWNYKKMNVLHIDTAANLTLREQPVKLKDLPDKITSSYLQKTITPIDCQNNIRRLKTLDAEPQLYLYNFGDSIKRWEDYEYLCELTEKKKLKVPHHFSINKFIVCGYDRDCTYATFLRTNSRLKSIQDTIISTIAQHYQFDLQNPQVEKALYNSFPISIEEFDFNNFYYPVKPPPPPLPIPEAFEE